MSGQQSVDLVFEGGGVKGIGLIGALAALVERGYRPENVAGASAGAIVAVLQAAGYTPEELHQLLLGLDFRQFQDRAWEDKVPVVGAPLSILNDQGIFEGERFRSWITERLAAKGKHAFADLVHPDFADEPRYRYRAQVIASDITARRLLVLPRGAELFGVNPDELPIADAVRMSMGIPIFFEPWRWTDRDGLDHLIVDGGVLSNFPVWLFDSPGEPEWPTFGLMLVEPEPTRPVGQRLPAEDAPRSGPLAVVNYLKSLAHTMLEAHDRMYLESASYVRTVPISTLGVHTTEFDISRERAEQLYVAGRDAATGFLEDWDFAAYKAAFRARKPPSRRQQLLAPP